MQPFRITIVGGGIGGFAAAIALRGPNRHITILEQSSLNKEIGALISFQPNASKILQSTWKLDLSDARPLVDEGFRVYDTHGSLVKEIPLLTKTEYEGDRVIYHRRDIHDVLRREATAESDLAGGSVGLRTGSRVVSCDEHRGTVTLQNGDIIQGDLIIGADGIHSVIRQHLSMATGAFGEGPIPTGHSAYRLMIPTDTLEKHEPEFCSKINPRDPFTSMLFSHDCRLIMGPGRQGEVYGIVALVPDDQMNEDPNASWVSQGDLNKMLETFFEFPNWITNIFKHSPDLGLWQLHDLEPLKAWHSGRVILIGDAAHAMLPTQGQGASQAIEDAEALGAFFEGLMESPSLEVLEKILEGIFQARHSRASLIQTYSRQAAKPAVSRGEKTMTMSPDQFMDFNSTPSQCPPARLKVTNVPIATKPMSGQIIWRVIWILIAIGVFTSVRPVSADSIADVLQRHQAVHEKDVTDGKSSVRRLKERATEACEACAAGKLSCSNERPCKRCRAKQIECVSRPSRISRRSQRESISGPPVSPYESLGLAATPGSDRSGFNVPPPSVSYTGSIHDISDFALASQSGMILDTFFPAGQEETSLYSSLNQFPAFFEHVMLPNKGADKAIQGTQQPRAFDFMQDIDFTLSPNDVFGTSFIPDLDKILDMAAPFSEIDQQSSLDDQESASRRADAFQRSLWLWTPEKNQHGFSEEQQIPLREGDIIPSTHQTRLDALNIPGRLSFQARDEIFKLVLKTAGSRLCVSAFPSSEYLDTLIKIGIGKRVETDAWIHLYTFYDPQYQQLRPELLTALVAAGCVCCGAPSINKTGIILQEITRVGLAQLVEEDNSVLRDLQYLQASMLWLDIGISCGYTRKMQIAESYLQPLCTALRRAAMFDRSTYPVVTPWSFGDDEVSLKRSWYSWVRQESLKRLVYHLFSHDVEVALSMNRPAITSYTEFTLSIPAARELWLAPTASAWRDVWIGLSELNLCDLLSDPSLLHHLPPELDSAMAKSALLQGLALQVWELCQQRRLSRSRATTLLWLQSRQEELYATLKSVQDTSDSPSATILMNEFTMMYLHIDMDAIQRFVGKMGAGEARRTYPGLREWSRTREAKIAIWHAGQVLRAARMVAVRQFRGFDSLSIYHASLVLWVYGLLQYGEKKLEVHTPMSEADTPNVPLDGPEDQFTKAFMSRGIGRPGLTMHYRDSSSFCELSRPRLVMGVVRKIFDGNCPAPLPGEILPPMIQNLCSLIEDLGNLP
ncbi:hypothetical protein N7520_002007 [Penicillium odoratum]|uniref:uncharacterized protein n=1 Tax=Penicillium odoratum TaxID=1167516 RepID=UPI002547BE5B|nr:uncharacterized protein N7520_002007 [Penicillium odoratum]KAJ5778761.1 hypothetical protein N7520_002007 [Penicillium odoratum]